MRKATAFRGGANKTAQPCETGTGNKYLATVPGEQLQRNVSRETFRNCFEGNHLNPVRQGWGTSPACLGIAIAPETLYFITTFRL